MSISSQPSSCRQGRGRRAARVDSAAEADADRGKGGAARLVLAEQFAAHLDQPRQALGGPRLGPPARYAAVDQTTVRAGRSGDQLRPAGLENQKVRIAYDVILLSAFARVYSSFP